MPRFRRVGLALTGVLVASTLGACGVADIEAGVEDGELVLWTHNAGNPAELAVVEQIVADYNASQDGRTVRIQAFPQEAYNDSVVAAATAKKLPCILDTDAPTVPNWAYAGHLAPLDLPRELVDTFLPSTLGIYDEQLYSIGYYDAALAIFARRSALEDAGVRVPTLEDPWTRTEFDEVLAAISERGDFEYAFDLGTGDAGTEWWTYGYSPFLQSFGGDLIDREEYRSADGVLNGEAALEWAAWLQGVIEAGYVPRRSGTDAFADFVNGKSAMVWSGIWNSGNLDALGEDGLILPPPDFGNGPTIGGGSWQWAVSSTCADPEGALDYLEFSLDPAYIAMFAEAQNVIPATEEAAALAEGWGPGGPKRFFLEESRRYAELRPPTPGYPFLTTTFAKAAQDIVAGGDPADVLDQAAEDIDANLETNDYYGF